MARGDPPTTRRLIPPDLWEQRLAAVRVDRQALNRLVANWLVAEGHVAAAAAFRDESGTDPGADLAAVEDRVRVLRAVRRGDVAGAVERVNDLDPALLERRPPLLFRLHCQRLVELVRAGDAQGALAFAEEYLAPAGEEHPELLEELERAMALLAFDDPASSPLGELLSPAQRERTAAQLNTAVLSSTGQEREARLPGLLRLVLWAQRQLSERADFPQVVDLATARLSSDPEPAAAEGTGAAATAAAGGGGGG